MRITGITAYTGSTLGSKNNVNFGKFADRNADAEMKKLLTDAPQWNSDMLYNMVKEEPSIIIRTEKDGTLQGEFDNEYMEANTEKLKKVEFHYDAIKRMNMLKDIHIKDRAEMLGGIIKTIQEKLDGTIAKSSSYISSREGTLSEEEYEERRIRDIIANSAQ